MPWHVCNMCWLICCCSVWGDAHDSGWIGLCRHFGDICSFRWTGATTRCAFPSKCLMPNFVVAEDTEEDEEFIILVRETHTDVDDYTTWEWLWFHWWMTAEWQLLMSERLHQNVLMGGHCVGCVFAAKSTVNSQQSTAFHFQFISFLCFLFSTQNAGAEIMLVKYSCRLSHADRRWCCSPVSFLPFLCITFQLFWVTSCLWAFGVQTDQTIRLTSACPSLVVAAGATIGGYGGEGWSSRCSGLTSWSMPLWSMWCCVRSSSACAPLATVSQLCRSAIPYVVHSRDEHPKVSLPGPGPGLIRFKHVNINNHFMKSWRLCFVISYDSHGQANTAVHATHPEEEAVPAASSPGRQRQYLAGHGIAAPWPLCLNMCTAMVTWGLFFGFDNWLPGCLGSGFRPRFGGLSD